MYEPLATTPCASPSLTVNLSTWYTYSIDVDGDGYIDALATPSPRFDGVWPAGLNPHSFPFESSSTSTSDKIDSMVRKTLEYHYTISALNKGGEEMN